MESRATHNHTFPHILAPFTIALHHNNDPAVGLSIDKLHFRW